MLDKDKIAYDLALIYAQKNFLGNNSSDMLEDTSMLHDLFMEAYAEFTNYAPEMFDVEHYFEVWSRDRQAKKLGQDKP